MTIATTRADVARAAWAKRHPGAAAAEAALARANACNARDFGHKVHGTVETHAKAARTRQGALARLHAAGRIDTIELGRAAEIAAIHARIVSGIGIRTVSLETRVDVSRRSGRGIETLAQVRRQMAYTRWRSRLRQPGPVLAMICDDIGVSVAAKRWRMRNSRALELLRDALGEWPEALHWARVEVDDDDLARAEARIG